MNDAGRLAIAILVMVGAFVLYFFAFHPNGVENVKNPVDMLQWLMAQFDTTAGSPGNNAPAQSTDTSTPNVLPTPTGQPSTNAQLTGQ